MNMPIQICSKVAPQPRHKRITIIPKEDFQFFPCFFFASAISQQHNHIFHESIVSIIAHELFEFTRHCISQLGNSIFSEISPKCSILNTSHLLSKTFNQQP
uniref:Uncharacterized protein n=1 Tax=Rhizophora mucronata TaxID=61149 RepID=A0A2P2LCE8_RHIMU